MSPPTPARRRWTVDEQKKLDDLLKAGKTADEIATALQRTPLPFIRGYSSFTENDRSHERPMTQPNGLRRQSAKDWTAADDERLRELLVKGFNIVVANSAVESNWCDSSAAVVR